MQVAVLQLHHCVWHCVCAECTSPGDLHAPLMLPFFLPTGYLEVRPNASAPTYPASYRRMPDVETALAAFQVCHGSKCR